MDWIATLRQRLVDARDTVCLDRARLATASHQRHAGEPLPLLRAHMLADVLGGMALDLTSNSYFAGNTSSALRAWVLFPEHGLHVPDQALVENPGLAHLLDGDVVPGDVRAYWQGRTLPGGVGHLVPEYPRVLDRGLLGVMDDIAALPLGDAEQMVYRQACQVACRAVIDWAGRYADAARAAAEETDDPLVAANLRRVAEACRWAPARPARSMFEALQAILLVHLAIHLEGHSYSVSLGRLDQTLLPFYRPEEDLSELLPAFLCKIAANSVHGSHSKTQAVTLAGRDGAGHDASNAVTVAFLRAFQRLRLPDPHLFVRWHDGLAERVKALSLEMLADGLSMPMFVGDEQTAAGLTSAGIAPEDANEYVIVGCNELGIPGKLLWESMLLIGIDVLRQAVLALPASASLADLRDGVRQALRVTLMLEGQRWREGREIRRRSPTPFTSALMVGCAERGRDLHAETTYPLANLCERGFTNLINGLVAIEQLVFVERRFTLEALQQALLADYDGHEPLRRALALSTAHLGDDDARSRAWAGWWLAQRNEAVAELVAAGQLPPLLTCHVVRSLHHVDGARIGATPDGRRAGEPLADSVGALGGVSAQGPTAVLSSVMHLDAARNWTGGYNLNWTLTPQALRPGAERGKTLAAVETFFAQGGQELQINVLDVRELEDAQRHPERHPGLLVRIAGFNALFVQLLPVEQEELIARARACAVGATTPSEEKLTCGN